MKLRIICALFLCLTLASGCAFNTAVPVFAPISTEAPAAAVTPTPTLSPTAAPSPFPSPTPALSPTPFPTPVSEAPQEATLGFVGDILMMQAQINFAKTKTGYDFTRSFEPMRALFAGVDVMCGNYEGTFAGEDALYSLPRPTQEPSSEENPCPTPPPFQTFNAPDELACNLKALGFDVLTTANNHCLDRGCEGLYRTIETIRAAGLSQTGTFLSEEARQTPLVLDVNGIRVGILAATESVNSNDGLLPGGARSFAVARLFDSAARVKSDIAACHAAGAEFIIVCAHWGDEFEAAPNDRQKRAAKKLVHWGADAVIGSHPHIVQSIETLEAKRDGVPVKALIVWSLGNFISNMSPSPKDYGLFVRLTLARGADGTVGLKKAEYLPVLCAKQKLSAGGRLHQTLPCYEDASLVTAFEPLDAALLAEVKRARDYVIHVCGTDAASLIG